MAEIEQKKIQLVTLLLCPTEYDLSSNADIAPDYPFLTMRDYPTLME